MMNETQMYALPVTDLAVTATISGGEAQEMASILKERADVTMIAGVTVMLFRDENGVTDMAIIFVGVNPADETSLN